MSKSVYSREIAKSFFSGVSELSTEANPYILLSQLASSFFLGWTGEDSVTRYERCILSLAAHAGKGAGLPQGFLWQVEVDWPEPALENWGRLWQSVLLEEDIQIYTDQKIAEIQSDLDERQRNIELLFTKDGGHYMRLSSISSDRHRHMMTKHVIPQFEHQYNELDKLRKQFESVPVEKQSRLLGELNKFADQLYLDMMEKKLEEIYQKGIYLEKIDDAQPFHTKICLRVISEAATAISDYCKVFLELETLRSARRDGHNYQNLVEEINKQTDISPLVHTALDQISTGSLKPKSVQNEEMESRKGIQTITTKLLSHGDYVHRFPHTISFLVNNSFVWESFLKSMMVDIEIPKDIPSATATLLDTNATGQVLLVVQQLPLDVQKLAQAMHRDQEKQVNDLENEFIKLGGDSEWIKSDHDLSRWGCLSLACRRK